MPPTTLIPSTAAVQHDRLSAFPAVDAQENIFSSIGLKCYLVFIASWFLHLGQRVPALGAIRFDLLLIVVISVCCLLAATGQQSEDRKWTPSRFVLVLVGYVLLTMPFVEWPGSVLRYGFAQFLKAAVFCLFTARLVTDRRSLQAVLAVFVGCQAFRVLEPLYLHVTTGYWGSYASMANWEYLTRLAGSPYDVVNPNGLAFVVVTSLAFAHFLAPLSKLGLLAYLAYLPLALWTLALTGSRTGMLAFAIVLLGIWWRSRFKILMAAITLVGVLVAVPMMPPDLADRYLSIFSSNTKNAATAGERTDVLIADLMVAGRRPFFGHGLGTSVEANLNFGVHAQPAHNLYVETLQEIGLLGLPILLAFMVALARELSNTRQRCKATEHAGFIRAATDALHVFFLMNVTFSLASYGLSGYEWYLTAGVSAVLARLSKSTAAQELAVMAPVPSLHPALRGLSVSGFDRLGVPR
jgi:putative inorganic carbon (hco3(-)) transporter